MQNSSKSPNWPLHKKKQQQQQQQHKNSVLPLKVLIFLYERGLGQVEGE